MSEKVPAMTYACLSIPVGQQLLNFFTGPMTKRKVASLQKTISQALRQEEGVFIMLSDNEEVSIPYEPLKGTVIKFYSSSDGPLEP